MLVKPNSTLETTSESHQGVHMVLGTILLDPGLKGEISSKSPDRKKHPTFEPPGGGFNAWTKP